MAWSETLNDNLVLTTRHIDSPVPAEDVYCMTLDEEELAGFSILSDSER